MPIFSYQCINCNHIWDELRRSDEKDDPAECSRCDSNAQAYRRVTAIGGYTGNTGSASTRPRGAGSNGSQKFNFESSKKKAVS